MKKTTLGSSQRTKKTRRKRTGRIVLKVTSIAKLLKIPFYEIQQNANHFGLTATETVKQMLKDRGIT